MNSTSGLRTWIEIDLNNLKHNIKLFRATLGDSTKMMGVVKSNAYGHGLVEFSKELEKHHIDWLGIDSITEALRLRKEGIRIPLLVLGFTLPERVREAIREDIHLTVSSFDILRRFAALNMDQPLKIHIKVDTGLHRQGFLIHEIDEVITFLNLHKKNFSVEGLYTHFAEAKNPASRTYTHKQHQEFLLWIDAFKKNGMSPLVHASATAGSLLYPEARFDMVRVGAGIYGIWPSSETEVHLKEDMEFRPVLSWKTLISEVKKLPKGVGIGYNLTERLSRDSVIAICPIGYWHGYVRSLSAQGEVLVRGKRARVLGMVAMDMIIIDVTDIRDISVLDEVVLIGAQEKEIVTADELAKKAGTTSYELLTRLNPLMRRIYYS